MNTKNSFILLIPVYSKLQRTLVISQIEFNCEITYNVNLSNGTLIIFILTLKSQEGKSEFYTGEYFNGYLSVMLKDFIKIPSTGGNSKCCFKSMFGYNGSKRK